MILYFFENLYNRPTIYISYIASQQNSRDPLTPFRFPKTADRITRTFTLFGT